MTPGPLALAMLLLVASLVPAAAAAEHVTQDAAGGIVPVPAVPDCCNFSGIWHNHPDINASIKYTFTQASGSCVVKGLHDCFKYNGSNATGAVLHGCPSFYSKKFPGGMTGTLKSAAPLDQLRWANGVHWYREHGAPCPAPEPQAPAPAAAAAMLWPLPRSVSAAGITGALDPAAFEFKATAAIDETVILLTLSLQHCWCTYCKAEGGAAE